ncbi:MAG: DUF433 domain-containing protein [Deltaproteobacteria bacterium]|nr:DUF433 domain-containing protein [Deltaproteobacteria bacterium]
MNLVEVHVLDAIRREHHISLTKVVVVDPYVSCGRPVLVGTGIATAVRAERFAAGESIEKLADDYGRQPQEIEVLEQRRSEAEAARATAWQAEQDARRAKAEFETRLRELDHQAADALSNYLMILRSNWKRHGGTCRAAP